MSAEADNSVLPLTETQVYLLGHSKACAGYSFKKYGKTDFPEWIFCTQESDSIF